MSHDRRSVWLACAAVALALVLAPSRLHAQSLPSAAATPLQSGFATQLGAAAEHYRGNVSMFSVSTEGMARYRASHDYAALFATAGYGELDKKRYQNQVRALARYRHQFFPWLSGVGLELFGHFERAEPRRHEALLELGFGTYVSLFEGTNVQWLVTLGYAFEYEQFSYLTDPKNNGTVRDAEGRPIRNGKPLYDAGIEVNSHRMWTATELGWTIRERVRIGLDVITLMPLDHCKCDTRMFSQAALRTLATDHFSIQVAWAILYDPAPARNVTTLDSIARSTLLVEW